jgi:uncharacterized protein DUF507
MAVLRVALRHRELHFVGAASKLLFFVCLGRKRLCDAAPAEKLDTEVTKDTVLMLLVRDYVAHMASEVIKRLTEGNLIETKAPDGLKERVRQRMMQELTVEDRLNDEVREILIQHQDEMRRTGVSYQEMYKKVKAQLARERKLVLR